MAVEELFPGLVKVTEERLGQRIGRPLTTVFTVVVLFGAGAWFIKLFVDNAVKPVVSVFYVESISVNLVEILTIYGTGAALMGAVMFAANRIQMAQLNRKHEAILEDRRQNHRYYRGYISGLNKIAIELQQQGVELSTDWLDAEIVKLTAELREEEDQNG